VTNITPRRRRFAAASVALGVALTASGLFLSPAEAAGPAVFGAGYDSYLNANQRGATAAEKDNGESCPTDESVALLTAWHFVLGGSSHDFASLDVAFTINGVDVTLSGLTPKTTAEWASFDPTKNYIADPSLRHAYVYTDGQGSVRDAAAQDNPDTPGPTFQMSHTCLGEGTGTTTTTEPTTTTTEGTTTTEPTTTTTEGTTTTESTTTTTEPTTTTTEGTTTTEPTTTTTEGTTTTEDTTTTSVSPSSTEREPTTTLAPTTSATVGGIQIPQSLPVTGSGSAVWLTVAGASMILAGVVSLRLAKENSVR
jgi:LPXTG-motif cell wall-anchored protein